MNTTKYILSMPYEEYTAYWQYSKLYDSYRDTLYSTVDVNIVLGNFDYYEFVDYSKYIEQTKKSFPYILQNHEEYFDKLPRLDTRQKFRTISGRNEKQCEITIRLSVHDNLDWFSDEFNKYLRNSIAYNNSCLIKRG